MVAQPTFMIQRTSSDQLVKKDETTSVVELITAGPSKNVPSLLGSETKPMALMSLPADTGYETTCFCAVDSQYSLWTIKRTCLALSTVL